MIERPEDIISERRCIEVHANANFGDKTPRQILNGAVMSYAMGFSTGSAALMILREHGLVKKNSGYTANLTVKGKRYARAISIKNFKKICALVGA